MLFRSSTVRLNSVANGATISSHSLSSFGVKKAEKTINSILSNSYTSQGSNEKGNKKDLNLDEITVGRKVSHDKFGVGTIVSATKTNNDVKVTIAFDNMGIKQLMFSMAPIKLI